MNKPESDLAFFRRAVLRCYRLAERTDLPADDRLRQIREQCFEALERPEHDGEVIDQLKATISEWKSKAFDVLAYEKEVGLLKAQLLASERSRREAVAQLDAACRIDAEGVLAFHRVVDLGCVLADAYGNDEAIALGTRALVAAAKRLARELTEDERLGRGKSTLLELLEAAG